ncbi:MAG TPA: GNAT family N-acetyltransferase [Candidatus Saccharimonadales bacterium]|jgi:ribosomal protein S18 acetylase RimI-like enzyme|nr:GNAT family N-acetyltransferase [Candidatus Saccharimonadales bacterium]
MQIKPVEQVSSELVDAAGRLAQQLSPETTLPTAATLKAIIASPGSTLLIAEDEQTAMIMGMATLVVYATPAKLMAVLESVVVDKAARGRGVGQQLVEAAITLAQDAGVKEVSLTSNPTREAANRLYQRLGFKQRQTNIYCYRFNR